MKNKLILIAILLTTLSGCATNRGFPTITLQPVDCSLYTPGECEWAKEMAWNRYQSELNTARQEYMALQRERAALARDVGATMRYYNVPYTPAYIGY